MTSLLIVAFVAGALTVAAPCILPLLPVVLGSSTLESKRSWRKPIAIILSLGASIFIFSILLKATTTLLGVPQVVWQIISGFIVVILGINYLIPSVWQKISVVFGISTVTGKWLSSSAGEQNIKGEILTGFALGPIFNSCSPTYALIVAVILPASVFNGLIYLLSYTVGLMLMLLLIAWLGRSIVAKLGWAANEHGTFRKIMGTILVITGLVLIFGLDKSIQTYVLDRGWYDPIIRIEQVIEGR